MSKISLNKALKLKNKKVANISKLAQRIRSNNSYKEGNKPSYDVKKLIDEYNTEIELLIKLKTAINSANIGITSTIIELGEIKSKISLLQSMSTNEGELSQGYGSNKTVDKYIAIINEVEKNNMIDMFEGQIEALQDKIDYFNATTEIEF